MNILLNIIIPSIILMKFSKEAYLGTFWGLIIALSIPFFYGIYTFIKQKKINGLSLIGLASLFLTGAIGLFELDGRWLAIKEAGIPFILGVVVFLSLYTKKPLIRLLVNQVIKQEMIEKILKEKGKIDLYNKRLYQSTFLFSLTFFLSSFLNYLLTRLIVTSPTGSASFNEELGQLTALSFPVIALPSTLILCCVLWYVFRGIHKDSGLSYDVILAKQ